jgi:hypothetical protein
MNCSLLKRQWRHHAARLPMSDSKCAMGVPRHRKVSTERVVKWYVPHSCCLHCPHFFVSLWAAGAPEVSAPQCRARENDGNIPHVELVCEHIADVSPGFHVG